jgi:hypothetical protein
MAIKLDLQTSQFGVPFTGAYFRIATACVSRQPSTIEHKHFVMIDVVGYAAVPEDDNTHAVDFRRYHAPLSEIEAQGGQTFMNKCYDWIMEQPDMFGSVAV